MNGAVGEVRLSTLVTFTYKRIITRQRRCRDAF